mgnify:CR=1 FL=1
MRRTIIFLYLLCISLLVYAQTWDFFYDGSRYYKFSEKKYNTIMGTNCYDESGNVIDKIKENNIFSSSKLSYVIDESKHPYKIFKYLVANEKGWVPTDVLVLVDSDCFSVNMINTSEERCSIKWVPTWYNEILSSKTTFEHFSDYYRRYKESEEYSICQLHNLIIQNTFLFFYTTDDFSAFSIDKIKKESNIYVVSCEIEKSDQMDFYDDYTKESFSNLPDLTDNRNCTFIIEQNGNRLRLYNGENYKLIIELMQTDKAWNDAMIEYINSDYKNKPSNLTPIEEKLDHPWSDPKTGLYEGTFDAKSLVAVQSTNVTPNKTMIVSENLKLRSGEATSTQVLTVMQAGTKVKILELGKAENIDGINSNWVKVEVLSGAKDRDGRTIRAGTIGWCYGGYLE